MSDITSEMLGYMGDKEKQLYQQLRVIENELAAIRIERMKLLDKQWDSDNRQETRKVINDGATSAGPRL